MANQPTTGDVGNLGRIRACKNTETACFTYKKKNKLSDSPLRWPSITLNAEDGDANATNTVSRVRTVSKRPHRRPEQKNPMLSSN